MKEKRVFIYLVIVWFTLLGIYIYIEKTGIKIFETKEKVQKIGITEAQSKIDALLLNQPITFPDNVSSFDHNKSYTTQNQQTLSRVVSLLKRVDSNIFIEIASHTDLDGTNSENRILSQKRADTILTFIKKNYPLSSMNAIGYGEEFPLDKAKNATNNRRIEITLQSLIPKI
ncbi:MAG TPA: OmpA family protein [Campylobacterales bacterium]|nr:OmpA family protein [Campylobacterales bacterium]